MIFTLDELLGFFYTFIRLGVILMGLPFFAGKVIPLRLRIALGAIIAYTIGNNIPLHPQHFHAFALLLGAINEVLVGFMLVLGSKIIFYAIDFAGQLMASEMGIAMSSQFNPSLENHNSTLSQLLFYFAITLAFILMVPQQCIQVFISSFHIIPAGGHLLRTSNVMSLVQASTGLFTLGMQIAAPILAINFLVNIVFAILGKAVPRMNVFVTSFSVRLAAGFLMFLLTIILLSEIFSESLRHLADNALNLL